MMRGKRHRNLSRRGISIPRWNPRSMAWSISGSICARITESSASNATWRWLSWRATSIAWGVWFASRLPVQKPWCPSRKPEPPDTADEGQTNDAALRSTIDNAICILLAVKLDSRAKSNAINDISRRSATFRRRETPTFLPKRGFSARH